MNNKGLTIYSFMLFMLFLLSMELWIGWGGRNKSLLFIVFSIFALLVKKTCRVPFDLSFRKLSLCIVFFAGYFLLHKDFGIREFFTQFPAHFLPILCIVCLKDEYKEFALKKITKWYSQLITVSIIIFAIVHIVSLPSFGSMIFSEESSYGSFQNYLFYVKQVVNEDGFPRFGGPFLEPGYVGMMGAFLLFSNRFDFKDKVLWPIAISIILSFSLAGWVLVVIGYTLLAYYEGRSGRGKILWFIILIGLVFIIGKVYNGGNNVLNNEILSRFEYDEEIGFSGNNRNTLTMSLYYLEMWSDSNILIHGYPESAFYGLAEWELIGAGYVKFMVLHGLLGLLYAFSFYILSFIYSKDKKFALFYIIFVVFSFWQRSYCMWFSWIICYYYASKIQDLKLTTIK